MGNLPRHWAADSLIMKNLLYGEFAGATQQAATQNSIYMAYEKPKEALNTDITSQKMLSGTT